MKVLLFFILVQINFYSQSFASSSCGDLANGIEDRMDKEGDSLDGVTQASNQTLTNGTGDQCKDKYGNLLYHDNGSPVYWGSCATYTSLARVNAILKKEGFTVPQEFQVNNANIVKWYREYGDSCGSGTNSKKGVGNAAIVTRNLLEAYLKDFCKPSSNIKSLLPVLETVNSDIDNLCYEKQLKNTCDKTKITKYFDMRYGDIKYNSFETNKGVIAVKNSINTQFNQAKPRLPIELIYDGWILDHNHDYEPRTDGPHVSLITGRRKTNDGKCQLLVRNSWKDTNNCFERNIKLTQYECGKDQDARWDSIEKKCMKALYKRTQHSCIYDTDSIWMDEDRLMKGTHSIRVPR